MSKGKPRDSSSVSPSNGSAGEVGYGRPPRTHQFKPGQSGNPKGRPWGGKNEATILRDHLHRKIPIRQDGKLRQISILEAVLMKFADEALKGNPKAAAFLLNRYAPNAFATSGSTDIDREDAQILESYTQRLKALLDDKKVKP